MQGSAERKPAFVTPGRFVGKVVVVTGAAQGIGERTARRISAEGGTLVLADGSDLVEGLADEVAARRGTCDLEPWAGARAMVVEAAAASAGSTSPSTTWAGRSRSSRSRALPTPMEAEIERSLFTTLRACRAVVPHLFARGSGLIVNVSSVATRGLNRVPYAAAKGGVNAITSSLALELPRRGVRGWPPPPGAPTPRRAGSPAVPQRAPSRSRQWYQTTSSRRSTPPS